MKFTQCYVAWKTDDNKKRKERFLLTPNMQVSSCLPFHQISDLRHKNVSHYVLSRSQAEKRHGAHELSSQADLGRWKFKNQFVRSKRTRKDRLTFRVNPRPCLNHEPRKLLIIRHRKGIGNDSLITGEEKCLIKSSLSFLIFLRRRRKLFKTNYGFFTLDAKAKWASAVAAALHLTNLRLIYYSARRKRRKKNRNINLDKTQRKASGRKAHKNPSQITIKLFST